jgi:hypothetical protein
VASGKKEDRQPIGCRRFNVDDDDDLASAGNCEKFGFVEINVNERRHIESC